MKVDNGLMEVVDNGEFVDRGVTYALYCNNKLFPQNAVLCTDCVSVGVSDQGEDIFRMSAVDMDGNLVGEAKPVAIGDAIPYESSVKTKASYVSESGILIPSGTILVVFPTSDDDIFEVRKLDSTVVGYIS